MREMDDLERLVAVLDLLRLLAQSEERRPLASPGYSPSLHQRDIRRIDRVMRYLQQHKAEPIALETVAQLIGLTPKSFCRFFKANTGKTFVSYLNELRIGDACQKLIETGASITEIAMDCGFNNLSNFNRRFREIKGLAPREFRLASSPATTAKTDVPLPEHRRF
jgi:AraC-like DNA-binding protein